MAVKSFITLAPGPNVIKLFTAIILYYGHAFILCYKATLPQ
jgi:hypothetical protein